MLLRYIIRRSEYQGNVWSFISDVTYWKDRISFAMFHGLCDGLGLNRFIEAVLYHYFCLRDGRKYSDEGIYTERIPYDPAEETDIHSKAVDGGTKMTNEKELAHPAGFEPTACRLGVFVGRVPWRSSEIVKALWNKDGGRFTVRLSLHFPT